MSKYTMYIDENGNSDMSASENNRFLSLTAILINQEYDKKFVKDIFCEFKTIYDINNIPLHRSDILNRRNGFEFLRDNKIRESFDSKLLCIIRELDFKCITVVIDKKSHLEKYGNWRKHPYHYCIEILMERFTLFLKRNNSQGKVIIEAQGKKEDKALAAYYNQLYNDGTYFVNYIKQYITNSKPAMHNKKHIVNLRLHGLELADLVGHPSMHYVRKFYDITHSSKAQFGKKLQTILQDKKYDRSHDGKIEKYGFKLLP